MIRDKIINHYKHNGIFKPKIDFSFLKELGAFNLNPGLGDSILLTSLTKKDHNIHTFSSSKFWKDVCLLTKNPYPNGIQNKSYFFVEKANEMGSGCGHIINSVQRAFLGKTDLKPSGFLGEKSKTINNKIGICLSTGTSYLDLIRHGYKNPRQIYDKTLSEIIKFIDVSNDYHFVEYGAKRIFYHDKVENKTGLSIIDSITDLSTCEYYIGLNSGFMNVAAAFDIKSIIIINVPTIDKVYLPSLNTDVLFTHDLCWLYPQNVHLHQDGENELVPLATCDNIKKAIQGDVYPFWSEEYLDLINYDFNL